MKRRSFFGSITGALAALGVSKSASKPSLICGAYADLKSLTKADDETMKRLMDGVRTANDYRGKR